MMQIPERDPVFMQAAPKKLDGRKARRKHFTIVELPARSAKGRYPKGQGFTRGASADGTVMMGDRIFRMGHDAIGKDRNDPYFKR